MSCLSVNAFNVCKRIKAAATYIKGGIAAKLSLCSTRLSVRSSLLLEALDVKINLKSKGINAEASSIGERLSVKCSIVCTLVQIKEWLNVTPAEIQWITDDIGVFYDVESNVDWIVVTS